MAVLIVESDEINVAAGDVPSGSRPVPYVVDQYKYKRATNVTGDYPSTPAGRCVTRIDVSQVIAGQIENDPACVVL